MKAAFFIHDLIEVDFYTDEKSFYDFVCGNYRTFVSESAEPQKRLKVRVLFHGNLNPPFVLANKIEQHLYVDNDRILLEWPQLFRIYLTRNKDSLEIVTFVHSKRNLKRNLKNLLRPIYNRINRKTILEQRYRDYIIIMRQSIHMPLFYILETEGFIILHGAAVAKDDYCYLFLGLGGIGKTTIALNLVFNKGFKFLTDDYILIKDNTVYSFPEKVRMTKYTLDILGLNEEYVKTHLKYYINMPIEKVEKKAFSSKLFFVFNSSEFRIERIDEYKAIHQYNSMHNYLAEFPEHFYLTFLPSFPQVSEMQNRYHQFFRNREIYNLYLSSNHDENIKRVLHMEKSNDII